MLLELVDLKVEWMMTKIEIRIRQIWIAIIKEIKLLMMIQHKFRLMAMTLLQDLLQDLLQEDQILQDLVKQMEY